MNAASHRDSSSLPWIIPLTPVGRVRLAKLIVDDRWAVRRAAERLQCSPATASNWACRYRAGLPMTDASSRLHRSPARCSKRLERRIVKLRYLRKWGPHRVSFHPALTLQIGRRCDIDPADGRGSGHDWTAPALHSGRTLPAD